MDANARDQERRAVTSPNRQVRSTRSGLSRRRGYRQVQRGELALDCLVIGRPLGVYSALAIGSGKMPSPSASIPTSTAAATSASSTAWPRAHRGGRGLRDDDRCTPRPIHHCLSCLEQNAIRPLHDVNVETHQKYSVPSIEVLNAGKEYFRG